MTLQENLSYVQSDGLDAFGRCDFDLNIRQTRDLAAINANEVRMFAAGVLLAPYFEPPSVIASVQSGQDARVGQLDKAAI